jgi:hypothetical protein
MNEVVTGIVGATVMSGPLIVAGVNMGNVRMASLINCDMVLAGRIGPLAARGVRGARTRVCAPALSFILSQSNRTNQY